MMLERLGIAALLVIAGLAAYLTLTRLQLWRARRAAQASPGLEPFAPGRPAILYFTAPGCVPCRTLQVPALEALQAQMGEGLQVIKIDATVRPEAANFWGVLSVPTTFVIDQGGRARRVNHGPASADKLRGQLQEIGEANARGAARTGIPSVEG